MRVEKIRDAVIAPPVKEVLLHLTLREYHDLLVVASIPESVLKSILPTSTYAVKTVTYGCQSYDVFRFLRDIVATAEAQ